MVYYRNERVKPRDEHFLIVVKFSKILYKSVSYYFPLIIVFLESDYYFYSFSQQFFIHIPVRCRPKKWTHLQVGNVKSVNYVVFSLYKERVKS